MRAMNRVVSEAPIRLPGFAVAQLFRLLRHEMDDALREFALTTPQWGTLMCLEKNEGMSGADMARLYHLTPQTMHTIVLNLEDAGLIVREPHPRNGTLLCVRLTDMGRDRLAEATRRVEAVHERMVSDLSDGERVLFQDLLNRCTRSLEAAGAEGGPCGTFLE